MKNFKQIAFGLMIGAMAIGFSAFTSAPKAKFAPNWVYVQTGADSYTRIAFSSYNETKCEDNSTKECSFTQPQSDGANHGSPLNYSTVSSLGMTPSTTEGLYIP